MGAEELKKRRPSHDKYIDRQRVALATPDLFTRMPEDQPRSFIAVMENGIAPAVGRDHILQADKGKLMGCIGNSVHFLGRERAARYSSGHQRRRRHRRRRDYPRQSDFKHG
jgi:hypothetical protein